MKIRKHIKPRNSVGQIHGYNERYLDNGNIYYRGNWKNDKRIGYQEYLISKVVIYFIR